MELNDIKPSLGELSDEELRELLMGIRQSRRISKAKPRAAKAKPEVDLAQLIKTMSPEQLAAAIAQLGGKK